MTAIHTIATPTTISDTVARLAGKSQDQSGFFVVDLGDVYRKAREWWQAFPSIQPFYAVKCFPDPLILKALISFGAGFDCASQGEVKLMLDMGVSPSNIIFAHPCKPPRAIKFARDHGVELMTYDNEAEIDKIKAIYPEAKLVFRVHIHNTHAMYQFGSKFGCQPENIASLLRYSKDAGLNVVGVSFHVGSGCYNASAYTQAVELARHVHDVAKEVGFNFTLLDIGGGFPGDDTLGLTFTEIVPVMKAAIAKYYPEEMGIRVISEPGQFFVSSAGTLTVNVVSKRKLPPAKSDEPPSFFYYIDDGTHQTLNGVVYGLHPVAVPLVARSADTPRFQSTIWGETCNSQDCVLKSALLPELENLGAYSIATKSTFNGFTGPQTYYTFSSDAGFTEDNLPAGFPLRPSQITHS